MAPNQAFGCYRINDSVLSSKEIKDSVGISNSAFSYRKRNGYSGVELLRPKRKMKTVVIFRGEPKTISELCKISGLSYSTITNRINRGLRDDELIKPVYRKDLSKYIGMRFGKLTVISIINVPSHEHKDLAICRCDCGNTKTINLHQLLQGRTKSCGCLRHQSYSLTHGKTGTPTYRVWCAIKARCLNENNPDYDYYGGRGITICDRWKDSFENFYTDMGERPNGKTIDRIDVDGNYEPSNCRWATPKEQSDNKRNNKILTAKGISLNVAQWSDLLGCDRSVLYDIYHTGRSLDEYIDRLIIKNPSIANLFLHK